MSSASARPRTRASEHVFHIGDVFHDAVRRHPDLATLTGVALETPLPETFKWTATVLKAFLSRQIYLEGQREEDFNAAAARLSTELAAREKEFAAKPKPVPAAPLPA